MHRLIVHSGENPCCMLQVLLSGRFIEVKLNCGWWLSTIWYVRVLVWFYRQTTMKILFDVYMYCKYNFMHNKNSVGFKKIWRFYKRILLFFSSICKKINKRSFLCVSICVSSSNYFIFKYSTHKIFLLY